MVENESLNENPEFLEQYLKYIHYMSQCSNTTVKETYYDIRTFLRYFIYQKESKNNSKISFETYKNAEIKNITLEELQEVTPKTITDFVMFLRNALDNSPRTRNRKLSSLKSFFRYLESNNYLQNNPAEHIELSKIGKRNPKYLNINECKQILSSTLKSSDRNNFRNYVIVCVLINCCLRVTELVNLNISDIDFNEKTMRVLGKGNKERIVYINEACEEAIKEYLKIRPELPETSPFSNALFLSEQKKRISKRSIQNICKSNFDRIDKDTQNFHTHSLRHTGASLMYNENDTDILTIQKILGHTHLTSTEIYTHVSNKKLQEIVNKFAISSLLESKEVVVNE